MLIKVRKRSDVASSEITPLATYLDRRRFIATAAVAGAAVAFPDIIAARAAEAAPPPNLDGIAKSRYSTEEARTPLDAITRYNNFYEFGSDKEDPSRYAEKLRPRPWAVKIDGLCGKPGTYDVDEMIKANRLEERVYRLRCVEAWSMVIPWVGIPFADVVSKAEPLGSAKFIAMQTLLDSEQMPGQRRAIIEWPYLEGLRLDEAMHPLAILAVGLYGEVLPNQNGAPIRLVVPWKYGFKSIKSIVRISFVEQMPPTAWNVEAPHEYGFYANVNPEVDHPRWSQKRERRIGEFFRRETLPFNGYADEVASLYAGMDLKKWF
jgi:sulfoxide reductase catalytic subunit YedY